MLQFILRRRRFEFAAEVLRKRADIEIGKTPVYEEVRNLFLRLSKSRLYSNEASTAIVLLMFSIAYVEEVRRRNKAGESTPFYNFALYFSRIPEVVRQLILGFEMKAPDRSQYEEDIGLALKAKFNRCWKKMVDEREEQREQAQAS